MFKVISEPADCEVHCGVTHNHFGEYGLEQFDHPSYSPDLTPIDLYLFLNLKLSLEEGCFHRKASFYEEDIDQFISRYDKCLNKGGNCVLK